MDVATLSMPGQPTHDLSLPRRNLRDCLAEELRRLDPDVLFGDVVKYGVPQLRESIAADRPTRSIGPVVVSPAQATAGPPDRTEGGRTGRPP